MKKMILLLALLALLVAGDKIYSFLATESTPAEIVGHYNEEWELQLEEPSDIEYLWLPPASFNGDGSWYSLLVYEKEIQNPENTGMILVTEENVETVLKELEAYIAEDIAASSSPEEGGIGEAFALNPIEINVNDYYVRRSKNHDGNIFIAIHNAGSQDIIVLQMNQ